MLLCCEAGLLLKSPRACGLNREVGGGGEDRPSWGLRCVLKGL